MERNSPRTRSAGSRRRCRSCAGDRDHHLQDQGGLLGTVTGYLLSRTVGVPGDPGVPGDIGNWGYLLGTVSLLVEGSFIVLALMSLWRIGRTSVRLDAVGS